MRQVLSYTSQSARKPGESRRPVLNLQQKRTPVVFDRRLIEDEVHSCDADENVFTFVIGVLAR